MHLTACLPAQEKEKRRHLLRLWVAPEDDWALPQIYTGETCVLAGLVAWSPAVWTDSVHGAERFGGDTVQQGRRGGILVSGNEPNVPLEAC